MCDGRFWLVHLDLTLTACPLHDRVSDINTVEVWGKWKSRRDATIFR